jgi:starvation-inducible DNA-binding protein
MENDLTISLKIVLANTFVMYFRSHSYHWNVEGKYFPQYHDFFGDLYEELHAAIDPLAESIRALDVYAPISLTELYSHKTLVEDVIKPTNLLTMITNLISSNAEVLNSLNKCFELANKQNEQGLADLIASRLDVHKKHAWMLKSCSKSFGE